jgi:hypothetical protein
MGCKEMRETEEVNPGLGEIQSKRKYNPIEDRVESKTEVNEERLDTEMEAMQQMTEDTQKWIFDNKWDFIRIDQDQEHS